MTYSDSCHPGTHPTGSLRLSKIAPCNLVTRDFLSRALRATFGRPNSFPTNLSHKIAGAYFEQLQLACVVSELQGCSEYQPFIDRKSTRLNSSHVRISYAVFCLKKKNR